MTSETINPRPVSNRKGQRKLGIIATISFLFLIAVSGTFWMRLRDRFVVPQNAQGSFSGAVKFSNGSQVPVLLEIDTDKIYAVALISGSVMVERARSSTEPLLLTAQDIDLTLKGQMNEYDEVVGTVESTNGLRGHFMLGARGNARAISADGIQEARSWVLLQAERTALEERLATIASTKAGKLVEIERLKNFVSDKERLRAGANEKFNQVSARLQAARDELNSRKERAQKLAASLNLAQRVTPFGRLVTLSRESNERELRWVESMLRAGERTGPAEIEVEVDYGLKILSIKNQIAAERERILSLGGDPYAQ